MQTNEEQNPAISCEGEVATDCEMKLLTTKRAIFEKLRAIFCRVRENGKGVIGPNQLSTDRN